jgi:hypothetical protein
MIRAYALMLVIASKFRGCGGAHGVGCAYVVVVEPSDAKRMMPVSIWIFGEGCHGAR